MTSGFNYKEFVRWAEKLGTAEKDFQLWLKMFLLQQAQRVVALAKERQELVGAIDTGAMINSWYIGNQKIALTGAGGISKTGKATVKIDPEKSDITSIAVVGDYLQVEIGNGMEYASYIEYGQRSYTGKYLLTIALDTVRSQLPARFNKEWSQFLKARGVV